MVVNYLHFSSSHQESLTLCTIETSDMEQMTMRCDRDEKWKFCTSGLCVAWYHSIAGSMKKMRIREDETEKIPVHKTPTHEPHSGASLDTQAKTNIISFFRPRWYDDELCVMCERVRKYNSESRAKIRGKNNTFCGDVGFSIVAQHCETHTWKCAHLRKLWNLVRKLFNWIKLTSHDSHRVCNKFDNLSVHASWRLWEGSRLYVVKRTKRANKGFILVKVSRKVNQ